MKVRHEKGVRERIKVITKGGREKATVLLERVGEKGSASVLGWVGEREGKSVFGKGGRKRIKVRSEKVGE